MEKLIGIFESKKFMILTSFIGLYLLSAGTSWAVFSYLREDPGSGMEISGNRSRIDPNLPKTEECPINGMMYSEPEREIWEERRPMTAIVENHEESRPQSGLSRADVIYEAVAEGGITRFLSIFYCGASAQDVKIAPIRSVRVYFINWAAGYGEKPIFVHIGGANNICGHCPGGVKPRGQLAPEADAFSELVGLGWRYPRGNDFDGGTNIGYPIIIRDQYRLGEKTAWEHSVVGSSDLIFEEAIERGFGYRQEDGDPWLEDFRMWKFQDDNPAGSPEAANISFPFWGDKGNYDVNWQYDKQKNAYLRNNGGQKHIDHETGQQLESKNVIIQFVEERGPIDDELHMFYDNIGEGNAIIFQNGRVIEGTWEKPTQESRTVFYNDNGEEIEIVRGPVWIEAVPDGNTIKY